MEQPMNQTKPDGAASGLSDVLGRLLPCPFCGGPVELESAGVHRSRVEGSREFWGVVCRNTTNLGGSCCMEQVPSASKKAAIARWNMRNGERPNAGVTGA